MIILFYTSNRHLCVVSMDKLFVELLTFERENLVIIDLSLSFFPWFITSANKISSSNLKNTILSLFLTQFQ